MFGETLSGLKARIPGARSVLLTGLDGMVVAAAGGGDDGPPDDVLAACLADLFRRVAAAHQDAGLPLPAEMTAGSVGSAVVLRAVTAEYLLVALLGPSAVLGRARFELRRAASLLEPELL